MAGRHSVHASGTDVGTATYSNDSDRSAALPQTKLPLRIERNTDEYPTAYGSAARPLECLPIRQCLYFPARSAWTCGSVCEQASCWVPACMLLPYIMIRCSGTHLLRLPFLYGVALYNDTLQLLLPYRMIRCSGTHLLCLPLLVLRLLFRALLLLRRLQRVYCARGGRAVPVGAAVSTGQ